MLFSKTKCRANRISILFDFNSAKLRKRDIVKNVVKNALGKNKDTSSDDADEVSTVPSTGRKMKKIKDGKKYEKIECLEEKAYQILKDLDMLN